ncbi:FKBP-type peptidyl-prolyl cis-trans isomerase [Alkalisalibacterium limincola]|uniref:Peptidyl-prolyl cis-trans isomerase n=1 Tax=Alkalisalibacterium limincola TaxID=2699169 RepID=A0A5C8KJR7_9GAMM|nr:FKBP-type peptidyl-prolyl cis-trans isomerase [Alkalisalibacterium limincola]TXK59634.1 FKBP-type peptidyl-prolyl cis-trans isomerase [Alkalisalibacterium limincola]
MKLSPRYTATALAVSATLIAGAAFGQQLTTEKDRVSYTVGMDMAQMIEPIKDELEVDVVIRAIRDSLGSGNTALTAEQADEVRQAFAQRMQAQQQQRNQRLAAENKAAGDAFLAQNRGKSGVQVTDSGLQYQVVRQGSGTRPTANSTVRVNYEGRLLDGTVFDSSYERGEPAQFPLRNVIPGWTEGLQLMQPGAEYTFWIPAELAYGERPNPGPIPPNATLVFKVELLDVVE